MFFLASLQKKAIEAVEIWSFVSQPDQELVYNTPGKIIS